MQIIMNYGNSNLTKLFPPCTGQDDDDNITRFLILAREHIIPGTDRPYKVYILLYIFTSYL